MSLYAVGARFSHRSSAYLRGSRAFVRRLVEWDAGIDGDCHCPWHDARNYRCGSSSEFAGYRDCAEALRQQWASIEDRLGIHCDRERVNAVWAAMLGSWSHWAETCNDLRRLPSVPLCDRTRRFIDHRCDCPTCRFWSVASLVVGAMAQDAMGFDEDERQGGAA